MIAATSSGLGRFFFAGEVCEGISTTTPPFDVPFNIATDQNVPHVRAHQRALSLRRLLAVSKPRRRRVASSVDAFACRTPGPPRPALAVLFLAKPAVRL
jgi:hypothetical protein